ncbi:Lipase, class 3 [Penicillium digitatum]|uniref:Lipase, class 3 n=1 Tax=Penicillium digitatum TaxID=36651 RepID=A0A7T6XLY3_PENDI|nr:hypothetical protein PDIDSM_2739 [Penicillium digitatum]QQK43635.1 Lipase, class 3 [Penicillium digitatum]
MLRLGRLWSIAALAALAVAAPSRSVPRDVSGGLFDQLTLFSQWAAASYCLNNDDSAGDGLSCEAGNCPLVEAADTMTLYAFDKPSSYGDVAGFLAVDKTNKRLVVSFRGTRTLKTWIANLNFGMTNASSICRNCKAHSGFLESWETVADDLTSNIKSAQTKYPDHTLVVTGHSFGGALATLGGTILRNAGFELDVYTYGQPRVGNAALADYITNQGSLWRVTHHDDLVPKVPPSHFGFSHASPEYWITVGDDTTVTSSDIDVIEGIGSMAGNAGTFDPSIEDHYWYLGHIDACR